MALSAVFFWGLYQIYYWPNKALRAECQSFFDLLKQKNFTQNWINDNIYTWLKYLAPYRNQPLRYLEIGSWEGTSAYFFAHHFSQAEIHCVDTWQGSDEHVGQARLQTIEQKFDTHMAPFAPRVTKHKGWSYQMLPTLPQNSFDVIYVDGSHYADDVLQDALNGWQLLKVDGVMVFDDALWRYKGYTSGKWPHAALKAFTKLMAGEFAWVHMGPQLMIKKTAPRQA